MSALPVRVAVGVIVNGNAVLISRRPSHVHQGGLWEFPGGKCEADETLNEALGRELQEELGIQVTNSEFLFTIEHDYGDKVVQLLCCKVSGFGGEPSGLEGQRVQWLPIADLGSFQFPDANQRIIEYLKSL